MKLLACGVRGTGVVTDPAFSEFGGDTSCYLVEGEAGEIVVIDAGSGLRRADLYLKERGGRQPVLLLLTHYHLDHLIGLPQFSALYDPACMVEIAAPHGRFDVMGVLDRLLAEPFWPVTLASMKAKLILTDLPSDKAGTGRATGGLTYHWCPVHHSGGCMAYRIDEAATEQSLIVATDLEWSAAGAAERKAFVKFCKTPRPADALILDGHVPPDETSRYAGWGHSSWADGQAIMEQTGCRRLIITHHAPTHADERLRQMESEMRRAVKSSEFLRQGEWVRLGAH